MANVSFWKNAEKKYEELSDEQIASILNKDIVCKTVLVNNDKVELTIQNHIKEGWELLKKVEVGERTKLTFKK